MAQSTNLTPEMVAEEEAFFKQEDLNTLQRKRYRIYSEAVPFLRKLPGNGSPIHCIVQSTNSNVCSLVISGHHNGVIGIWDIVSGQFEELRFHDGQVHDLSLITIDEQVIVVSGSTDHSCQVFNAIERKKLISMHKHQAEVRAVHCALMPQTVGSSKDPLESTDTLLPVAFSSDVKGTIFEWEILTGEIIRVFGEHIPNGFATSFDTFCPVDRSKDSLVFTSYADNKIRIWQYSSGKCISVIQAHSWPCLSLSLFRPENLGMPLIVSGGCDKFVVVSDSETKHIIRRLSGHTNFVTAVMVVHPVNADAPYILSICMDGLLLITDIYTGKLLRKLQGPKSFQKTGLCVSQRHGYFGEVVFVGGADGFLYIWDLGAKNGYLDLQRGHKKEIVVCEVFSLPGKPELNVIATAGFDTHITLWNQFGERVANLTGHSKAVTVLIFENVPGITPYITLISSSLDGSIKLWNPYTFELIQTFTSLNNFEMIGLCSLVCHQKLYLAACAWHSDSIAIWDVDSGHQSSVKIVNDPNVSHASYSVQCISLYTQANNGVSYLLACDLRGNIFEYDMLTGELHRTFSHIHTMLIATLCVRNSADCSTQLLITGSGDNSAAVSNLSTGAVLYRCTDFEAPISKVEVHNCNFVGYNGPMLFIASGDTTARSYALDSGELLQHFDGHNAKVLAASVLYLPHDNWAVVTCCHDAQMVIWDMSYDRRNVMPPGGSVAFALFSDFKDTKGEYKRIGKLVDQFGDCFFQEYAMIFSQAIFFKRVDFIRKFQNYFVRCVRRMRRNLDNEDVLQFIMNRHDVFSMKLLLTSWSICLNEPPQNSADQRCLHLSHFIDKSSILQLANRYPSEFCRFMGSLKLVAADAGVNTTFPLYNLHVLGLEIASIDTDQIQGYFDKSLDPAKVANGQPISTLYLPFLDACDMEFLQAYVNAAEQLNSVDIFNSDVATIALTHIWMIAGRASHMKSFRIYALYTLLNALSVYSFQILLTHSSQTYALAWAIQGGVVVFNLYFLFKEYEQMQENSEIFKYFGNVWNWMDLNTYFMSLAATFIRISANGDVPSSQGLLALSSILTWFKVLYFLRAFSSSGPLVSMILQIAFDIRYFLLVLFLVLAGFAQAFFILSVNASGFPFSTIRGSFLNSFVFMLGNFDMDFAGTAAPSLGTLLVVIFLLIVSILMLNLLIALMGQSFTNVAEKGRGQWKYEVASILIDQVDIRDISVPPCIFVLKYTSEIEESDKSTMDEAMSVAESRITSVNPNGNGTPENVGIYQQMLAKEMALLENKFESRLLKLEKKIDLLLNLVEDDD